MGISVLAEQRCGRLLTFVFVEGQQDDGAVVVELRLIEERDQPEVEPVANEVNGGVVALTVALALVGIKEDGIREGRTSLTRFGVMKFHWGMTSAFTSLAKSLTGGRT